MHKLYDGFVQWPDGRAERLAPSIPYAGVLLCPRTGEVLARWGWGVAPFTCHWPHPSDRYCPLFEDDTWWPTISRRLPEPILRRIFLYFCDEAQHEGLLK